MSSYFPQEISTQSIDCVRVESLRYPLIAKFYQSQGYNIKCGRLEVIFVLQTTSVGIIGAARLLPLEDGSYWLRNLLVAKAWRQQSLGSRFMQELLQEIAPKRCFCFALPEVESFYHRLGFINLEAQECPQDMQELAERYTLRSRGWRLMRHLSNENTEAISSADQHF
jgi:N-acetylglutamate synthase-like GNAT family acetyltransferase